MIQLMMSRRGWVARAEEPGFEGLREIVDEILPCEGGEELSKVAQRIYG